jgi:hypothetical protein
MPSGSTTFVPGEPFNSTQDWFADICIGIVAPLVVLSIDVLVLPEALNVIEEVYVPTDAVTSPLPVIVALAVVFSVIAGRIIVLSKYSCEVLSNTALPIVFPTTS